MVDRVAVGVEVQPLLPNGGGSEKKGRNGELKAWRTVPTRARTASFSSRMSSPKRSAKRVRTLKGSVFSLPEILRTLISSTLTCEVRSESASAMASEIPSTFSSAVRSVRPSDSCRLCAYSSSTACRFPCSPCSRTRRQYLVSWSEARSSPLVSGRLNSVLKPPATRAAAFSILRSSGFSSGATRRSARSAQTAGLASASSASTSIRSSGALPKSSRPENAS